MIFKGVFKKIYVPKHDTMLTPFYSAVNVEDFLREGMKEIPSLAGAKFSSQDLVDLIGCTNLEAPHRENKKFNILYGNDAVIPSYLLFSDHDIWA